MSFSHAMIEAATAATVSISVAVAGFAWWNAPEPMVAAETLVVAAGAFDFEPTGEFVVNGIESNPADRPVAFDGSIAIMRFQVTLGDYLRCVDAKRCEAPDRRSVDRERPVVGVNFLDAEAYARWYSDRTGERWRLPTPEEWALVAAERFAGEVFTRGQDPSNPAVEWIRRYQEQVRLDRKPDPVAHPSGYFGPNSKGVEDIAGNVWEWTSGCYTRSEIGSDQYPADDTYENCGIRIAEGVHRAYLSNFIRIGKSGGCAVGTPPDHLGFRLVKDAEDSPWILRFRRNAASFLSW